MPAGFSPVTLRLEPALIPAVRTAVDESLAELRQHLARLGREGYIPEPWLGDSISSQMVVYYNSGVMEAAGGPYAALRAYEGELVKVLETLQVLEEHYRRTEGDNVALWGRV